MAVLLRQLPTHNYPPMIQIDQPKTKEPAILQLGFRLFFLSASAFAVLIMLLWLFTYTLKWHVVDPIYTAIWWHGHEMLFGYSFAVVAGFLLTAIRNWTGVQTLHGLPLLGLFLLWLIARLSALLLSADLLWLVAVCDILFGFFFLLAAAYPLFKVRQWKQLAIVGKLLLMVLANLAFYLGMFGIWDNGIRIGLYSGIYLFIALIFNMGRRVIPFFIEKGVGYPFAAKNWKWLDVSSLLIFLFFSIADVLRWNNILVLMLAFSLLILHGIRLYGWYTPGIWKKPLLWSLYLGYVWIVFGFLLKCLSIVSSVSPFLALHSFTFGGIGMVTIGMMARVALGHTGNNVFDPPAVLKPMFFLLAIGAIARVILPLLLPSYYMIWVGFSQIAWIGAFGLFFVVYFPILIRARVDGMPG